MASWSPLSYLALGHHCCPLFRREVTTTTGRAVECRRLSAFQLPSVRPPFLTPVKMDSIKSKMKSLSEATAEATKRTNIYEEEINRINDIADKFEEQVRKIECHILRQPKKFEVFRFIYP